MNFTREQINERLFRIKDVLGVAMYLVIGDEKAILIDTGFGFKGLNDYVREITSLPIEVLLSHAHLDHALGIYEFDNIYLNSNDLEEFEEQSDINFINEFLGRGSNNKKFDFQNRKPIQFKELSDRQIFDLGGIHIEAFHTPGHTKGSMMFLIKEMRIMIFGDSCGNTLIVEDNATNISTFLKSLLKIKEVENEYDIVYRFHGSCESSKGLLDNVIEIARDILNGCDDKEEVSKEESMNFAKNNPKNLKVYRGRRTTKTKNGKIRVDGKEGNINYREDKAI